MWKKSDSGGSEMDSAPRSSPVEPKMAPASSPRGGGATIGPSITIRGEVTGEEDLIVQGHIEGTINLKEHNVTIGKEGQVVADVHGRVIEVDGSVEGDLHGQEQIVMRSTGRVKGNVRAPRVTLEDGCRFKGAIDMDVAAPAATQKPAPAKNVAGIASGGAAAPDKGKHGDAQQATTR